MAGYLPRPQDDTGLFVATTDVYEMQSRIQDVDVNSEEFKLLLVRLYQNLNNIVLSLNIKDSAYYVTNQFLNGQLFFPLVSSINDNYRQAYRIVVNVGALAAGVTTVPHTLPIPNPNTWTFTRIYGTATDNAGNNFYPIPWVGVAGAYISLQADLTNVVIDNQSGVTFNTCLVILEFLKS